MIVDDVQEAVPRRGRPPAEPSRHESPAGCQHALAHARALHLRAAPTALHAQTAKSCAAANVWRAAPYLLGDGLARAQRLGQAGCRPCRSAAARRRRRRVVGLAIGCALRRVLSTDMLFEVPARGRPPAVRPRLLRVRAVGDHPQRLHEPRILRPRRRGSNSPATQSAQALGELKQAIILQSHEAPPLLSAHTAAPKDQYGARAM